MKFDGKESKVIYCQAGMQNFAKRSRAGVHRSAKISRFVRKCGLVGRYAASGLVRTPARRALFAIAVSPVDAVSCHQWQCTCRSQPQIDQPRLELVMEDLEGNVIPQEVIQKMRVHKICVQVNFTRNELCQHLPFNRRRLDQRLWWRSLAKSLWSDSTLRLAFFA